MKRFFDLVCVLGIIGFTTPVMAGDWVVYVDDTAARLQSAPGLGSTDTEEKDYAIGDLDQDGDLDLVCVRKQPWMATGRRRNVLFMNEGVAEGHAVDGVLVDRTVDYVTAADDGGMGFLDLTSDRDVQLMDVNADGWLDMVTATTLSAGEPKTISHPRVYLNLGAVGDDWLGFMYEEERTPEMSIAPKFCGLGFGDVTGDDAPDLYFIDYENPLEDRLWINDGTGTFTDESEIRMTFEMRESEFGVFAVNADLNGDGFMDVIKCRSNGAPYRISISYNDPGNEGFFDDFDVVYTGAPYYVEIDDLNNDGLPDVVINDDGIDRYLLNQGNGADGLANFSLFPFPAQSDGFSGKTIQVDLDNDGFTDVLVADATVNGFGCNRHLDIWRNDGNTPNISFVEESGGIPISERMGTWDVAPIDLNGDGWQDLVIGTCTGTKVWMAEPPASVDFVYPQGLPSTIPADEPFELLVELDVMGLATVLPGEVILHSSVNEAPFVQGVMVSQGGDSYLATLPAAACTDRIEYYVTVGTAEGPVFSDPVDAPTSVFSTVAAAGLEVALEDTMEGTASSWTLVGTAMAGNWEQATPNGTVYNGSQAAPPGDASPDPNGMAFVTGNGAPGGAAGAADVDGGPISLISPSLDLGGSDALISSDLWFFTELGAPDVMDISVSNDGGQSWTVIESVEGTDGAWSPFTFLVSDHVAPTPDVQVRYRVDDTPNDSITEAGVDNFRVEAVACGGFVRGDCNADAVFDLSDPITLLELLFGSATAVPCDDSCDHNDDGLLSLPDAIAMLAAQFSSGDPPAAPYPACGPDPTTGDGLDCAGYGACP